MTSATYFHSKFSSLCKIFKCVENYFLYLYVSTFFEYVCVHVHELHRTYVSNCSVVLNIILLCMPGLFEKPTKTTVILLFQCKIFGSFSVLLFIKFVSGECMHMFKILTIISETKHVNLIIRFYKCLKIFSKICMQE